MNTATDLDERDLQESLILSMFPSIGNEEDFRDLLRDGRESLAQAEDFLRELARIQALHNGMPYGQAWLEVRRQELVQAKRQYAVFNQKDGRRDLRLNSGIGNIEEFQDALEKKRFGDAATYIGLIKGDPLRYREFVDNWEDYLSDREKELLAARIALNTK